MHKSIRELLRVRLLNLEANGSVYDILTQYLHYVRHVL